MAQHTPAPWKQEPAKNWNDSLEDEDNYRRIYTGETPLRSFLNKETGQGFELVGYISETDARLIAAAPDMYEQLIDGNSIAHDIIIALYSAPEFEGREKLIDKLNTIRDGHIAAISKAEGK